jgi:hypothetical protein
VLGLTDALAALAEVRGGRGAAALRPALQQLCKAALDALHARSLSKLTSEGEGGGEGAQCVRVRGGGEKGRGCFLSVCCRVKAGYQCDSCSSLLAGEPRLAVVMECQKAARRLSEPVQRRESSS